MIPKIAGQRRIIVSVLDWGLGHATRCIPIVTHLQAQGHTVSIAGNGTSLSLIQGVFPEIVCHDLPAYNIRYSHRSIVWSMIIQGPRLALTYWQERRSINRIAKKWKADYVISDNRFGARSTTTTNIYITHQINVQHSVWQIARLASRMHRYFIHLFDECWIPDTANHQFSGILSEAGTLRSTVRFIGPLSRLQIDPTRCLGDQILLLLSGPEPTRTSLEHALVEVLRPDQIDNVILIRGTRAKLIINVPQDWNVVDLADHDIILDSIYQSKLIICRSGYSTIMDLEKYPYRIIYIPTPGQTEQEYLAQWHGQKSNVTMIHQDKIHEELPQILHSIEKPVS